MRRLTLIATAVALCACQPDTGPILVPSPSPTLEPTPEPSPELSPESLNLSLLGRYSSGEFLVSAAEIVGFDTASQRAFVVNALAGALDVLDLTDPTQPQFVSTLDLTAVPGVPEGAVVNSVAVNHGLGAARDQACAPFFNSNHSAGNSLKNRSDNKGPEPEGVDVARFGDKIYAFLGLERMGGVMVFEITDPTAGQLVDYLNTREEWLANPRDNLAAFGDSGAEGVHFIPGSKTSNGQPWVIVGHEVSGTTSIYQVNLQFAD